MNKKKIIASILIISGLFIVALKYQSKKPIPAKQATKQVTTVVARSVADSKNLLQTNQYPANIVGDQQVDITSKTAGTVIIAPGNIGSGVAVGSLLARVDDSSSLGVGEAGLKSLQVQQAEIAAQQAKKSYDLAKDAYDNLKKSSLSTNTQKDSAKTQRDIAKLQYENATLGLSGSIDNHLLKSPISGVITNKAVSVGDSVSVGQLIASISKSSVVKVQFYVDADHRNLLRSGQKISAINADGESVSLLIKNIAAAADQTTKRFLIEAYPEKQGSQSLLSGTIITVSIESNIKPKDSKNFILPLSAINVGQNESSIFVLDNKVVKKEIVTIVNVDGENAEISSNILPETLIIINGNKLVHEGEIVALQN
jgi:RND family efflux transporter MFP subunit